jgi:K+/H+ antiporter YhaU regulatory subunit KhtT
MLSVDPTCRELVILGEGVDFFVEKVPASITGRKLAGSEIGARTGLNVVGLQRAGKLATNIGRDAELYADAELVMIGTSDQRKQFHAVFE